MRGEQGIAQGFRRMCADQIVNLLDVAQRLAHLGAAEVEHAVVQPPARKRRAAVGALALRDLVLVVRELQVDAARVDVDGGAEVRFGHRRAFDVPARAATAPRRLPAGQVVGGWLPQHEVAGIPLVRRHFDPGAGQHVIGIAPRQFAVVRITAHCEQRVALRGVSVACRDQALDHRDDHSDVVGGCGFDVRRKGTGHAERGHVFAIGRGVAVGDRTDRGSEFPCCRVDLVVDVGDVARVAQSAEAATQQCSEHPEHHRAARIADVHVVVDGGTADVHGWASGIERLERFNPAAQGVVKVQAHGVMRRGCRIVAGRQCTPCGRQRRFICLRCGADTLPP